MIDSSSDLDRPIHEVDREEEQDEQFDFVEHRRAAVEEYRRIRGRYEAFAQAVKEILVQALRAADIRVSSVEPRAKDPESFGAKAELPSDSDHRAPKYRRPIDEITDLAGVRIIAFFPRTKGMSMGTLWQVSAIASVRSLTLLSTQTMDRNFIKISDSGIGATTIS